MRPQEGKIVPVASRLIEERTFKDLPLKFASQPPPTPTFMTY